jgi:2,4-dienoyl-CoA reductase-like NADH-dependent reductase (Old Yellow Enzyme family)
MPRLADPVEIGTLRVPNRLYRAPLLECAGNGPDAVDALIRDLEPAARSGAGLLCQGATIVTEEGGCAAPNMTRVADPDFVAQLERLTDRIHEYGSRILLQLEVGGLRSMETWHAGYRADHPDLQQLAVSRPPLALRAADRAGLLEYDPHVMDTAEVYDLADRFGEVAGWAAAAGYDGIHLAGANMGLIQQFLSPYYNRRADEFGGSLRNRVRFLREVYAAIRERTDVPVVTKVPAETAAPPFVRRRLDLQDGLRIAELLDEIGFEGLVPVETSTFWDQSIVRGEYPERAWTDDGLQAGYEAAFGSRWRARLVRLANRVHAREFEFEPAWNAQFSRWVRERVDATVLCEGGIRERPRIDRLLGADDAGDRACDMVGMARPFYAEPELPARLLADDRAAVVCESCNNCTVPQAAGEPGVCRTPRVLEAAGRLRKAGAYEYETAGPDGAGQRETPASSGVPPEEAGARED